MINQRSGDHTSKSQSAYQNACRLIPGGVNSPVRAYGAVGGVPRFIAKASGAMITDIDGNEYIDYVGSWGPMILGHAPETVVTAIKRAAERGSSFGAPTETETRLAELIVERVPSVQMVRLVNSGTEAVMSAVRLARAHTARSIIIKFAGCYHGHADALLVEAGSGATTFGTPSSPGVPAGATAETLVVPYNDIKAVRQAFLNYGSSIAAVLVEPIAGNMGLVPPIDGFLQGLGDLCSQNRSVLIFDEVMTGFRVAPGGAQELYDIAPDLTCLGKIVGGGLPLAAYGGRKEIMQQLAPAGPVYQAGTLSGNPLATAAGIATLEALAVAGFYEALEERSAHLAQGLAGVAGVGTFQTRIGSMLCTFFAEGPLIDYAGALKSNTQQYARFFHAMLERGVYLPPSQFECMFVSAVHTEEQVAHTVSAAREAFALASR